MSSRGLSAALAQVGRAVVSVDTEATDGQLLARYIQTGEEPAFTELVRRLGPMVLGLCRRVTADSHLAEDAFQAAFLVLARRAGEIRPREAVRGWLYGVAARTARKARAMSARRRGREISEALRDRPAPPTEELDLDVVRVLDEEIAALPECLRAAVILCELDGVSRKLAARRLEIPEGTLSSRLAKARRLLADRLRRRGIAPSAIGLCWAVGQPAYAALPGHLVSATASMAGGTVPVPASVAALTHGVLRAMFLTKLKIVSATAVFLALAVCAAGSLIEADAAAAQPATRMASSVRVPVADVKPRPVAKPAGPGTLLLARESGVVALTPDGEVGDEIAPPKDTRATFQGRLSPDGTQAAFVINKGALRGPKDNLDAPWPYQVIIRKRDDAGSTTFVDFAVKGAVSLCWSPDGKKLLVSADTGGGESFENVLVDVATGKKETIDLPAGVKVVDWSRDGKAFLVLDRKDKKYRLGLAKQADAEARELTTLKVRSMYGVVGRLTPDGTEVLFTDADPEQKDAFRWDRSSLPYVLDVATGKREPLADFPVNAQCRGVAWSPDGKRIAYTWVQLHPDVLKLERLTPDDVNVETEAFLVIADRDGKNQRTVASAKANSVLQPIYGSIDWR